MSNSLSEVFVHKNALNESDQVGSGTRIWAFAHVMSDAAVGKNCNIGKDGQSKLRRLNVLR